jgi:hypothetical protein
MEGRFADSPLRLNRGLGKLEAWNEVEITKRAGSLADLALQVWQYPQLTEDVLSKYSKKDSENEAVIYTLSDHPHYRGRCWLCLKN